MLPTTSAPKSYDIYVEPDLAKKRFAGKESVAINVNESCSELVLNGAELKIEGRP